MIFETDKEGNVKSLKSYPNPDITQEKSMKNDFKISWDNGVPSILYFEEKLY